MNRFKMIFIITSLSIFSSASGQTPVITAQEFHYTYPYDNHKPQNWGELCPVTNLHDFLSTTVLMGLMVADVYCDVIKSKNEEMILAARKIFKDITLYSLNNLYFILDPLDNIEISKNCSAFSKDFVKDAFSKETDLGPQKISEEYSVYTEHNQKYYQLCLSNN